MTSLLHNYFSHGPHLKNRLHTSRISPTLMHQHHFLIYAMFISSDLLFMQTNLRETSVFVFVYMWEKAMTNLWEMECVPSLLKWREWQGKSR